MNYNDVTLDLRKYILGYDIWYSEKGCWLRKNRNKRDTGTNDVSGTNGDTTGNITKDRTIIRPKIRKKQQIS